MSVFVWEQEHEAGSKLRRTHSGVQKHTRPEQRLNPNHWVTWVVQPLTLTGKGKCPLFCKSCLERFIAKHLRVHRAWSCPDCNNSPVTGPLQPSKGDKFQSRRVSRSEIQAAAVTGHVKPKQDLCIHKLSISLWLWSVLPRSARASTGFSFLFWEANCINLLPRKQDQRKTHSTPDQLLAFSSKSLPGLQIETLTFLDIAVMT